MLFQPTIADAPEIARLTKESRGLVFYLLPTTVIVKEYDGKIIGYASYCFLKKGTAKILNVFVKTAFRKQRYGDTLMRELAMEFGRFKAKRICVTTKTPKFFEKYGFRTVSKGKDNFTMAKEIPE